MPKPDNPYCRGSMIWSVMEGDWADLTVGQIAEVLDTNSNSISGMMSRIKRETGYFVPHANAPRGRRPEV